MLNKNKHNQIENPLDLKSRGSICWGVNMIEQIMSAYGIHPVDIDHVTRKVSRVTDGVIDFSLNTCTMKLMKLKTRWSICEGVNMIEQIMSAYGIHPVDIDHVTRKVSRVTDGVIDFALKTSTMTSTSLTNWQQVLHQANHSNLPGVLPVYLTI